MTDFGYKLGTLAAVDTSLAVAAGGSWVSGSSFDLGAATSPQAFLLGAQFGITNTGSTDGYDLDVIIQWSDDDTNWPDDGEGELVAHYEDSTAGADLTRSTIEEMPTPQARYGRFQYANNNTTDAVTVNSEVAQHEGQSA